jgi:hypothetical protein
MKYSQIFNQGIFSQISFLINFTLLHKKSAKKHKFLLIFI